jgi:hypothetical protein
MATGVMPPQNARRLAIIALLTWLAMLGFDVFLHGGLLARLYLEPSPFLLPAEHKFQLIPLGYAAFALGAILLVWLMTTARISGTRPGLLFGLRVGALVWGAQTLGLASMTTARPALLAAWFVGESIQTGIAGAFAGAALAATRLRRVVGFVVAFILIMVLATVLLQSTGLAPAEKYVGGS